MASNSDKREKQELSIQDIESMELLQKASAPQGRQLRINLDTGALDEINELKALLGKKLDDPDEKYATYYTGIRNILMKNLPQGDDNKEIRELIYDEKNIFLSRGKKKSDNSGIRKGDGRMTYQENMNEILDIVVSWVSESQIPIDLYNMLYNLNEKHNYGHENYDKTTIKYKLALHLQELK